MLYVLEVIIPLPVSFRIYKDGDYFNYLKQSLSESEFSLMENKIKKLRETEIKIFNRTYTRESCTALYVSETEQDRETVINTIREVLGKSFNVVFKSYEENMSLKQYIFLK